MAYIKKKLCVKREISWYEACVMWDQGLLLTKDLKNLAHKMFGPRTAYSMCRCIDSIERPHRMRKAA